MNTDKDRWKGAEIRALAIIRAHPLASWCHFPGSFNENGMAVTRSGQVAMRKAAGA